MIFKTEDQYRPILKEKQIMSMSLVAAIYVLPVVYLPVPLSHPNEVFQRGQQAPVFVLCHIENTYKYDHDLYRSAGSISHPQHFIG